jgi:sugar lactone lactonase YvrE
LAVDSSGQVYVGSLDGSAHVYEYSSEALKTTLQVTNLTYISDLAIDSAGNLYVGGNLQTSQTGQVPVTYSGVIDVYASGAQGSSTPSRVITTSAQVLGIAVDTSGVLYANENPSGAYDLVSYAAGASGAATPTVTLNVANFTSQPTYSSQIRLDADGNLFTLVQSSNGYLDTTYYAYPTPLTPQTKQIVTFTAPTAFASPTGLAIQ